jgi:hypothetical protein
VCSSDLRQFPDLPYYVDGVAAPLSKGGTFIGHHIMVPKKGVAVHINAFNFPIWGMLEKIAVNLLAGVPAVVKPSESTCYLTELMVKEIVASGILPEGALQLVVGLGRGIIDHVTFQDVVTFTGSAATGMKLKALPHLINESVPFNLEADSLNACVLGPDVQVGSAEFDLFVSKARIIGDIFRNLFLVMRGGSWKRWNGLLVERFKIPRGGGERNESAAPLPPTREGGLNISFVLDSLMCPDRGLRPLDLEAFAHNDEVQPLRIVSSAVDVETGMLKSVVFGSREGHFRDGFANPSAGSTSGINSTALYPEIPSAEADEQGYRRGLWACLGASMTVPGAAGSPFRMDLPSSNDPAATSPHLCFDAFCYEPIPFRSAVAEGATHVLALRSRPAGFEPKTKPTLYERAVAPLYFRSHGAESVAQFFERGGQQYIYAEDVLICDEGLDAKGPIAIPPAEVLYGAPEKKSDAAKDRSQWTKAHLLPITVPADVPELGTLSDSREEILAGIRAGFAAVSGTCCFANLCSVE